MLGYHKRRSLKHFNCCRFSRAAQQAAAYQLIQCSEMAERTALTLWKYSSCFELLGEKDKHNIMVKCQLCLEDKVLVT